MATPDQPKGSPFRILVKMPNWVGDCIMATPALALTKGAMPGMEIDALCRPSVAGILKGHPDIQELVVADDRKMPDDILARLQGKKYDAIMLLTNSLGSAWLARKVGAPIRVGFNRNARGLLLKPSIPFTPGEWQSPTPRPLSKKSIRGDQAANREWPRPMVMYYLRIAEQTLRGLDPAFDPSKVDVSYELNLPVSPESTQRVDSMIRVKGLGRKLLIGLNPGAAHGPAKRWSPERLGHLMEGLVRPDWAFVSTASHAEKELNDEIQAASGQIVLHRLGEETSLPDLPALINRLAVLVTNDSGAMHIAAARKVPVVALFGPTDVASTRPWMSPAEVVRHPVACSPCFLRECPIGHPCMDGIEPYDVAEAMLRQLQLAGKWNRA